MNGTPTPNANRLSDQLKIWCDTCPYIDPQPALAALNQKMQSLGRFGNATLLETISHCYRDLNNLHQAVNELWNQLEQLTPLGNVLLFDHYTTIPNGTGGQIMLQVRDVPMENGLRLRFMDEPQLHTKIAELAVARRIPRAGKFNSETDVSRLRSVQAAYWPVQQQVERRHTSGGAVTSHPFASVSNNMGPLASVRRR